VSIQPTDPQLARALGLPKVAGALVASIDKESPAARAGLQPGDVITAVDGTPVAHARELLRLIARHAPNDKVRLDVVRGTQTKTIHAILDKLETAEENARPSGAAQSGELGISLTDAPEAGGALVERVDPDGAAQGELEPGDVIVEVGRRPVHSASEAAAAIKAAPTSAPLLLSVKRDGHMHFVAIERK
jgi:serine protease Do